MPASVSEAASPSKAERCKSSDNASLLHWRSSFLSWECWECFLTFLSENESSYPIVLLCSRSLSHVQLFVTLWAVAPPGSSVHRILQTRILEWVAISSSRDWTCVSCISCIDRWILYQLSHLGRPTNCLSGLKHSPRHRVEGTHPLSLPPCPHPSPLTLEATFSLTGKEEQNLLP